MCFHRRNIGRTTLAKAVQICAMFGKSLTFCMQVISSTMSRQPMTIWMTQPSLSNACIVKRTILTAPARGTAGGKTSWAAEKYIHGLSQSEGQTCVHSWHGRGYKHIDTHTHTRTHTHRPTQIHTHSTQRGTEIYIAKRKHTRRHVSVSFAEH